MDDLDAIGRRLRQAFPDWSGIGQVRWVSSGFSNAVVETGDETIVRIGRNARAAAGHALERALLPAIAPRLPVPVPSISRFAAPGPLFPHGAIAYPRLRGSGLQPGEAPAGVARELAEFLLALHAAPVPEVEGAGLPRRRLRAEAEACREAVLGAAGDLFTAGERGALARWFREVAAEDRLDRYRPVLIHGDPWYEHVLVEDGRLCGVLDFEAAAIGDPAADFAAQSYLGEAFTAAVIRAYAVGGGDLGDDPALRARRYRQLREIAGLAFVLSVGDEAEIPDSVQKVRAVLGMV
jgi:aminoglycoside phosphotransferase (APT) family kinase protein